MFRSLTQYKRDEDGEHDPGPRPGDRPRHAQRGLHRVDVHDQGRRQVGGRQARHRRGGRLRHQALPRRRAASRPVPARVLQALLPGRRQVQRSLHRQGKNFDGITVDGQDITIKMAKPFPDMDYWGAFPAMGPAPLGKACSRRTTASTAVHRSLQDREVRRPTRSSSSTKNDQWDPDTDPARHQFVDKCDLQVRPGPGQGRPDHAVGQRRLADDDRHLARLGQVRARPTPASVTGPRDPQTCTVRLHADPGLHEDHRDQRPSGSAFAYAYENIWLASRRGSRRHPRSGQLRPAAGHGSARRGLPGDGEQIIEFNPEKAKELLAEAGVEPAIEITMVYYDIDPLAVAGQKQLTKGLRGGRLQGQGDPGPGLAVRRLDRPGQQDQQEAEPAWRQLVLRTGRRLRPCSRRSSRPTVSTTPASSASPSRR